MKVTIEMNQRFEPLRAFVAGLPAQPQVPGTPIYEGRNAVTRVQTQGFDLVVKAFRRPNLLNSFVYAHVRQSKACRSYRNAMRLNQLGLGSPEPVGWLQVTRGGRLTVSYYVSVFSPATEVRDWQLTPRAAQVEATLPHYLHRLYEGGVWFKDLSGGNVLLDAQGHYSLCDVNRMTIGQPSAQHFLQSLCRLNEHREPMLRLMTVFFDRYGGGPLGDLPAFMARYDRFWRSWHRRKRLLHGLKGIFAGKS